jgi:hypothetical protein
VNIEQSAIIKTFLGPSTLPIYALVGTNLSLDCPRFANILLLDLAVSSADAWVVWVHRAAVYRVLHKFENDIATYISLDWLEILK